MESLDHYIKDAFIDKKLETNISSLIESLYASTEDPTFSSISDMISKTLTEAESKLWGCFITQNLKNPSKNPFIPAQFIHYEFLLQSGMKCSIVVFRQIIPVSDNSMLPWEELKIQSNFNNFELSKLKSLLEESKFKEHGKFQQTIPKDIFDTSNYIILERYEIEGMHLLKRQFPLMKYFLIEYKGFKTCVICFE